MNPTQPKISTNQLTPNTCILVNGILDYCRITSRIEGEELRKQNEQNIARGWQPENAAHTRASLKNASVHYANPQAPTLEEQYAAQNLFVSNKHPEKGNCFNARNKGSILPWVAVRRENAPNVVDQINPEGELAAGLNVTFVLRVYKPKNQMNNGVSLDGIIVNEPVRYYQGNATTANLSALGITFNPVNTNAQGDSYTANPAVPNGGAPAMPFAPAPQFGAPAASPFTAQPQPAQPVDTGYAVPQTTQPNNGGGIVYNPADRNY